MANTFGIASSSILNLNLVKVVEERFDSDGNISETWESAFHSDTGEYIGGISTYSNGSIKRDGSYQN
jgi:hypothetical protein